MSLKKLFKNKGLCSFQSLKKNAQKPTTIAQIVLEQNYLKYPQLYSMLVPERNYF